MEPKAHAVKSGACNEVTTIPIEFSTYTGSTLDKDSADPVRDRWIYVFKKLEWGTTISSEICVDDGGNLKLVNWHGKHWVETDDRPADVSRDDFEVSYRPEEYDLFFFLSRVQLARQRIEEYTGASGIKTVVRRGMHFEPGESDHVEPLGDDCAGCRVYLTDHIRVAQERHEQYKKAADRYGKFLDDEEETTRQMLATLTHNVAKTVSEDEPEVWSWMDREKLKKEIDEYESERQDLEKQVKERGQLLCDWMQRPAYEEMLFDYTGTEKLEDKGHDLQAGLCAGLSQCDPGREYLEGVLESRDSWHNKVVVPTGKYLFGQSRRTVGAAENAVTLLQEFAATMAASNVNKAGSLVQSFFKMRFNSRISFYETIQKTGGGLKRQTISFKQFVEGGSITKGVDVDETASGLKSAEVSMKRITAVLNVINLAMVGKSVVEAEGTEKQALAMVDLTWAIGDVASSITDFVKSSPKTQLVGRTATIVGGVLGYGKSVYKIATRSPDQNAGVTAGLSLAGLGGAFTAASGVSALTGSLFVGLGSTGIGLIGVGLATLGAGVVYYFKETDLEKWFKQCPWGTEASSQPARQHLDDLFKVLAGFTVQCDVLRTTPAQSYAPGSTSNQEYTLRFRIFPGLFYPKHSVFKISNLTIGGNDIGSFTLGTARIKRARQNREVEFTDGSVLDVEEVSGQVEEIARYWGIEGVPTGSADYEYTATLDVLGDGEHTVEVDESGSEMPMRNVDGVTVKTLD